MQITMETPQVVNQHRSSAVTVQERVARIERLTTWLDSSLPIPGLGINVGWDTVIGLLPGVGDLVTTAMSGWIINEARLLGVSKFTLARMITNTTIDALIGSVPLAGDLFDAAFKANVKNLRLLKKSMQRSGHTEAAEELAQVRDVSPQS